MAAARLLTQLRLLLRAILIRPLAPFVHESGDKFARLEDACYHRAIGSG
jgi:hypothetical protein